MFDVIASTSCRMWLETRTLLPARAQSLISRMVRAPHQRVHAAQRLVEDEQLGVVHDRLRQLDALPHALAVAADLPVRGVDQIDDLERPRGSRARIRRRQPIQAHQRLEPPPAGHPLVERILVGAEPDARVERGISPDRLSQHADRARCSGASCPVTSFMNVDLPAPLGPSRPVTPRGIATLTSFRPDTSPYHFERCSATTTTEDIDRSRSIDAVVT